MSNFTSPLAVVPFITESGAVRWKTLRSFEWRIHDDDDAPRIRVPEGFIFDGATIPWGITLFLPRAHPRYLQAAALHDWMLENERPYFSRCHIDQIFKQAVSALGNPAWRVLALGGGVAMFGLVVERRAYYSRTA